MYTKTRNPSSSKLRHVHPTLNRPIHVRRFRYSTLIIQHAMSRILWPIPVKRCHATSYAARVLWWRWYIYLVTSPPALPAAQQPMLKFIGYATEFAVIVHGVADLYYYQLFVCLSAWGVEYEQVITVKKTWWLILWLPRYSASEMQTVVTSYIQVQEKLTSMPTKTDLRNIRPYRYTLNIIEAEQCTMYRLHFTNIDHVFISAT